MAHFLLTNSPSRGTLRRLSRIALLSPPIGNGNLGDEAIVAAVIQNIRRRLPNATIYALSPHPDDTRIRHGIEAYPIAQAGSRASVQVTEAPRETPAWMRVKAVLKRFPLVYKILKTIHAVIRIVIALLREIQFLAASLKRLKGTDLLIMTGSGAFCDHFGGSFDYPYTIFKWSLLAKTRGIPVAFPSVGAGPLFSPLSRFLVRVSLRVGSYRSVREVTSKQIFDKFGLPGANLVLPDLAYSLEITVPPPQPRSYPLVVGINAFPHADPRFWPEPNPTEYQAYVTCLAFFTSWLIKNKYRVLFFPTQIRADVPVFHDVKSLISYDATTDLSQWLLEPIIQDVPDLISALARTDIVVATRFHGILLAFLLNRPVVAISNHHKMTDLMRSMGQSRYLLDINSVTSESLIALFTLIESRREAVSLDVAHHVAEFRYALDRQYDDLLGECSSREPDQLIISQTINFQSDSCSTGRSSPL